MLLSIKLLRAESSDKILLKSRSKLGLSLDLLIELKKLLITPSFSFANSGFIKENKDIKINKNNIIKKFILFILLIRNMFFTKTFKCDCVIDNILYCINKT